jgi:hypothetical protein
MPASRAGMVQAAQEAGFGGVSERLVTDWASLGLLDHPNRLRREKGSGRGAYYAWPDTQVDLFLSLLQKRPSVKRVAELCVLPVAVWIYWGEAWIGLPQARRALRTWSGIALNSRSEERRQKDVRVVVNAFFGRKGSRSIRAEIQRLLLEALRCGTLDVDQVLPQVEKLLIAQSGGQWGAFALGARELVDGMRATLLAIDLYDELTDEMFEEARGRHRQALLDYIPRYRGWAADPKFGWQFEEPTMELLFNRSCRDLLLSLGLLVISHQEGPILPPLQLPPWHGLPSELQQLALR